MTGFVLALAIWVGATAVLSLKQRPRGSRAYLGMVVAHVGVAVFVVGVTLVKTYESDKDLKMKPGDTVALAGYLFRLDGVVDTKGPNYVAARARISVTKDGAPVTVLHPEKRLYTVQNMPMTEAAIAPGPTRDLYASLCDPFDDGSCPLQPHP